MHDFVFYKKFNCFVIIAMNCTLYQLLYGVVEINFAKVERHCIRSNLIEQIF